MPVIKKTLFDEKLEKVNVLVNDTDPNSKYFKITELNDTFTGGKNAFLIQGSEYLVPDTIIKIQIKDANGDTIYYEPGEGMVSSSVNGESFVSEYYEGTSKVVSVYIYPNKTIDENGNPLDGTAFGPATITILGELKEFESDGLIMPIPSNWMDTYNVKWTKTINVNPLLPNVTKIRFYKRPFATIKEILQPLYTFVGNTKVASSVTQSFADIKLLNLETFAGDVKRVKVFRTSQGDISDYDLIQDVLLESKELLTTYGLSGSVVGNTGIFTSETLQKYWNTGSLTAQLTSSRVESGLKLSGSGILRYSQSLDINSANTYELNLDAFYSGSVDSNLGIYLSSGSLSSSIGTLYGITPTKNLSDVVIPFSIPNNYPSASLYFSQSNGEWHLGNVSLKLSQDTAFSPDSISFITTMPTILGNDVFNFKFEFYDLNNNYVPVFVTQSATFVGAPTTTNIDTNAIISASVSQSNAVLYQVSSSISGTMTTYSSSASGSLGIVSGSVFNLSGSVSTSVLLLTSSISSSLSSSFGFTSSSVYTLSSSVSSSIARVSSSISQSVYQGLLPAFARVQNLADGNYSGSFISGNIIYSPVIGGQLGYFSTLFKVGQSPNSIYLDARQTPRKIFIGGAIPGGDTEYSGAYNNPNTSVYLDSTGQFSLKDKLTFDTSGNLSVNGSITITNPSTANNGGKVGGFSNGDALTGGSIAGVTIASTKIYIGTGTFANTNTGFYVDSSGQFSLKDKLYWNGTTLNIEGNVVITGGSTKTTIDSKITGADVNSNVTSISGGSITTGTVAAGRIDVSGVISAGGITVNSSAGITGGTVGGWSIDASSIRGNSPTGGGDGSYTTNNGIILSSAGWISSAKFYIKSDGTAAFKGDISAATGTFTGGVSGTGYSLNNSGLSLTNAGSSISLGNGVTLNSSGLSGTGFTLTTSGISTTSGTIGGWSISSTSISKTIGSRSTTLDASTGFLTFGGDAKIVFNTGSSGVIDFLGSGGIQMYATSLGVGVTRSDNGHRANLCVGTTECIYTDWNGSGWAGYFVGPIASTGNITAYYSDERLKTKISNIPNSLDKIQKLNGFYYTNNDLAKTFGYTNDKIQIGVSAQEVKRVFPEIVSLAPFDSRSGVSESGEDYLTVDYTKLVPVLIEAIKELKAEIEELKRNK